jgi:hypothetical protein
VQDKNDMWQAAHLGPVPGGYVRDGKSGALKPWIPADSRSSQAEPGAHPGQLPSWYDATAGPESFAQIIWFFVDTALAKELSELPPLTADRTFDRLRCEGYARAMAYGRWFPSPGTAPIQLSKNGEKRANGLHRLKAIGQAAELNESFTGIWTPFTYSDECRGMDVGKAREAADSFRAGPYADPATSASDLVALTRWGLSIDTGQISTSHRTSYWTHDELLVYLKVYHAQLSKATMRGRRYSKALRVHHGLVPFTAFGVAYFLIQRSAGDARADRFFTWLTSGELSGARDVKRRFIDFTAQPVYKMQTPDGKVTTPYSRDDRLAMVLSAWLAFDEDRHQAYSRVMRVPGGGWTWDNWPGRSLAKDFSPKLFTILAS